MAKFKIESETADMTIEADPMGVKLTVEVPDQKLKIIMRLSDDAAVMLRQAVGSALDEYWGVPQAAEPATPALDDVIDLAQP